MASNKTRAIMQQASPNGTPTEAYDNQEQAGKSLTTSTTTSTTSTITTREPTLSSIEGSKHVENEELKEEDTYEAQANVLSSVLADPMDGLVSGNSTTMLAGPREDENEGEGEEDEDDEELNTSVERRIFSASGGGQLEPKSSLTSEMRKFRHSQRHKLLAKASKRRRKKRPKEVFNNGGNSNSNKNKSKRINNMVKSTLTRQGSNVATTTVGYGNQADGWLPPANQPTPAANSVGVGGSLRQHLPSFPNPLQLSSTVQRLLLDKFSGGASTAPMSLKQQLAALEQQQQQATRNSIFFQHPSAFSADHSGEPLLSHWLAHGGDNTFASSSNPSRAAAVAAKQAAAKMIPIEIIGLDPLVTRQILQSEATGSEPTGATLFSSSNEPHLPSAAATSSSSTRQLPSIVHVHHFHTQQPRLPPPSQAPLPPQSQPHPLSSSPEVSQQEHQVAQNQQQQVQPQSLYWNDKGQLVYLSGGTNSGADESRPSGGQVEPNGSAVDLQQPNPLAQHPQQAAAGEQQEPAAAQVSLDGNGESLAEQQQPQTQGGGGGGETTGQRLLQPAPDAGGANLLPSEQFGNTMSYSQVSNLATNGQQLAAAAANRQQQVFMATNGQTFSVLSQQHNQHQLEQQQRENMANNNNKLLMVAYKPQLQSQQQPSVIRNSSLQEELMLKGAYNEGQESKASMVSAGGLVLRPLSSVLAHQFPAHQLHPSQDQLMEQVSLNLARMQQANLTQQQPPSVNMAPAKLAPPAADNRVPSSSLASYDNGLVKVVASNQLRPHTMIDGFAGPNFLAANSTAPADELKVTPLKVIQPLAAFNNKLGSSSINSRLNSSNYNEEILKRLLQELRLKNQHNSSSLGDHTASGSSSVDQTVTANAGQRYLVSSLGSTGPHRKDLKSSNLYPLSPHGAKLKPHNQVEDSIATNNNNPPVLADQDGNIALAFIFIVSLLTITLIAASMIYRHKRRSVARCSSLPARSRLNLTQRTKRFMRSNFVRPSHHEIITPIRSLNLEANSPTSGAHKAANKGDTMSSGNIEQLTKTKNNGKTAVKPLANVTCRAAADRFLGSKQQQPEGPLSTFTSLSQFGGGGGGGSGEEATADIKTLNTRLQKSTYLKSLISASNSDCPQVASCVKQAAGKSAASEQKGKDAGAFCYLNIRHKSPAKQQLSNKKSLASNGNAATSEYRRSQSFKKLSSDLHSYNFAFKASPFEADRISVDSKHNRISTIHSTGDSTPARYNLRESPVHNNRKSNNISYRANELNNLMGQKHLARPLHHLHHSATSNLDNHSHHHNHSHSHNQTDRL